MTFWRSTEWRLISESHIPTSRALYAVLYWTEKFFWYVQTWFAYLLDGKEGSHVFLGYFV